VLSDGQDEVSTLAYAPLGATIRTLAVQKLASMTLNGKPLVKFNATQ
jgi:hypothetical protein